MVATGILEVTETGVVVDLAGEPVVMVSELGLEPLHGAADLVPDWEQVSEQQKGLSIHSELG